ncbi:MAG: Omp28-related outer membrane protein [Crocinitomicaceae bacterium]|nr:Omp28-related outer membrane protein [Crocinitomicaceae bacterium]
MKGLLYIALASLVVLTSCDKVDNTIAETSGTNSNLDYSLYPGGDEEDYEANFWPTFPVNPNSDRNVLIEDYAGHRCLFCPDANAMADSICNADSTRVFVSTVHSGPSGTSIFQAIDIPTGFVHDFTCPEGLEYGVYFGQNWPGSPFVAIPYGAVSRADNGNGYPVTSVQNWASATSSLIATNDLKVNLQAASNYFPGTNGFFLHVEADILDLTLSNDLNIVVELIEETIVQPQEFIGVGTDPNYVHRNILRTCIDGFAFGQLLDANHLAPNGKYYYDYSYQLPAVYDASNMHVLIYIRDAITEEVYHVIEQPIN